MDLATITAIRAELESELIGNRFGKIFQLSRSDIAVDFRLPGSRYLFISIEPSNPRIYLVRRKLRELERGSGNPTPFSLGLRKRLSGATVSSVAQLDSERVLLLSFDSVTEAEEPISFSLVVQVTGASANLFLLDSDSRIVDTARQTLGEGQQIGDVYNPPERPDVESRARVATPGFEGEGSLSEKLDAADLEKNKAKDFQSLVQSARSKIKSEVTRREKLLKKLEQDIERHGEAESWKRRGDILLANASTARRDGEKVWVTDYFQDDAPEIAIEVDENESITEAAEKYFKRYTKARNAANEIEQRRRTITKELERLRTEADTLERAIESEDVEAIEATAGVKRALTSKRSEKKKPAAIPGVRRFTSSDGFEILVGKKAKDNDYLTFRVAKSLDTWMHAADYPGSHVVIRNADRKEIPQQTLLEAAQLAAFYSQGKTQPKAAVHYTQKKFVNKPRGAAPGLVSLASFKTLLVAPAVSLQMMNDDA